VCSVSTSREQFGSVDTVCVEVLLQVVMSEIAGLQKVVHTRNASNVYPPIRSGFLIEFIVLNGFFRDVTEFEFGKLGSFKRCHEVYVGEVEAHTLCAQGRNDTFEEYFDNK
jgi:hypothetical protein